MEVRLTNRNIYFPAKNGVNLDLNNAQTVLKMAGIIDDEIRWQAGETTLVQTGDIVDR